MADRAVSAETGGEYEELRDMTPYCGRGLQAEMAKQR